MMLDYDPPKECVLPLDRDGLGAAVRAAVQGFGTGRDSVVARRVELLLQRGHAAVRLHAR